ncbi:MAG: hypothetical protein WC595_05080 [Candidatus Nanoarchaeia archaeon]
MNKLEKIAISAAGIVVAGGIYSSLQFQRDYNWCLQQELADSRARLYDRGATDVSALKAPVTGKTCAQVYHALDAALDK